MKKGTRLSKFEKKCDEDFLLGYSTTSKAYRVWNLASGTLEEVHDVEFDETNGSQEEVENLDDVKCNNPKIHTPKITTTKFLLLPHAMLSDICRSQP